MNYNRLYKDVRSICKAVTRCHELSDDLTQEVMLIALSLDDIEDRYYTEKKRTLNFLLGVAYKQWNWQGSPFNRTHNNTYFDSKEKIWKRWSYEDVHEYKHTLDINNDVDLFELLSVLDEVEQIWMYHFIKSDLNKGKLSEELSVSRPSINKVFNEIFNKLRAN